MGRPQRHLRRIHTKNMVMYGRWAQEYVGIFVAARYINNATLLNIVTRYLAKQTTLFFQAHGGHFKHVF
jgi:hypothetical protein